MSIKNSKGFTLIELIIVIVIIGILAAIFIPTVTGTSWFSPSKCIDGYLFVDNGMGGYNQVIGTNGGAVECSNSKPKL